MNTVQYLIKKLEELGINDFFGVPGDYNFNVLRAIQENQNTRFIGCTNELNAGYAADGYARIKGYGGIVTTYGVGELSAVNAIAGSMAENIPVIIIAGIPDSKTIEKRKLVHHNLSDINYNACFEAYKNFTTASAYLTKDNSKMEIDRVLKAFVKERKPVYLAIPEDVAEYKISDRDTSYEWNSDKKTLEDVCNKIADKIKKSKKPLIIGDVLVKRFDSDIEYREFVFKSKIRVTNFLMGKNIIDTNIVNFIGDYYSEYENLNVNKYINESDCVISVGTIYSDINSFGCKLPFKINDQIAIYGTHTFINGKRYNNVKMADVLEGITELIEEQNIIVPQADKNHYFHKASTDKQITSEYIYPRIQEFLKENDIVFTETGTVSQGVSLMKFPTSLNAEFQSLWASVGWATPAVFGAGIAKPNSRVVLITGDGAHQFTALEIGNILKYGLKPVIIVINNHGYTIERVLSGDNDNEFNDIVQINYAKLARIFEGDVWATKVNTEEDFDKALKVTQIMNKMCYIEVNLDKNDHPYLTQKMYDKSFTEVNTEKEEPVEEPYENTEKIDIEETNKETKIIEENKQEKIILTTKPSEFTSFKYETMVHKSIENCTEEEIDNKNIEEKEDSK